MYAFTICVLRDTIYISILCYILQGTVAVVFIWLDSSGVGYAVECQHFCMAYNCLSCAPKINLMIWCWGISSTLVTLQCSVLSLLIIYVVNLPVGDVDIVYSFCLVTCQQRVLMLVLCTVHDHMCYFYQTCLLHVDGLTLLLSHTFLRFSRRCMLFG